MALTAAAFLLAVKSARSTTDRAAALPEVTVSDDGIVRYLHLGTPWVQGAMRIRKPLALELQYIQRMMAWLLFVPVQDWELLPTRRAMQLGLGAAALTKYHHQVLNMRTTAIELNPQVLAVCRHWFKLGPDVPDALQVLIADAGVEIQRPARVGSVDVLHVDLYDHEAAAPVLDSADFYRHCQRALTPTGVMAVNLFGRTHSFAASLDKITAAFGAEHVWTLKPTQEGNTIVIATAPAVPAPSRDVLQERSSHIEQRLKLPAARWVRSMRAVAQAAASADW